MQPRNRKKKNITRCKNKNLGKETSHHKNTNLPNNKTTFIVMLLLAMGKWGLMRFVSCLHHSSTSPQRLCLAITSCLGIHSFIAVPPCIDLCTIFKASAEKVSYKASATFSAFVETS